MSLLAALALSTAHAASCDSMLAKIGSMPAEKVSSAFSDLARCDKKMAEANFYNYLGKATDSDAAVSLFLTAIDLEIWTPVWDALSKISSYDARDEVSERVGASCGEHPKVVSFLQGAYFGLRDIDFQQWDDGYRACEDAELSGWIEKQVETPPNKMFDEKFNALMDIFVRARRVEALPALAIGAAKAATDGGPFSSMLMKMGDAVAPELGGQTSAEEQKKLEEALVSVAQQVPAEQARGVANQLANTGSDAAAARLLPTVYPDRVQSGGSFLYGAVSVEAGDCSGKKSAVLHYTTVTESGSRWSILSSLEGPMHAYKGKLAKCDGVQAPWPIISTPEPLKSASDIDKWLGSVQADWEKNGYSVKTQKEKPLSL